MPPSLSINHCHGCGFQIPVRLPREAEQSHSWECKNCGAVTCGVFDEAARASITDAVTRRLDRREAEGLRSQEVMRLIEAMERCLSGRDGGEQRSSAPPLRIMSN